MFKKSNFFLKLFRVVSEEIFGQNVLFLSWRDCLALIIIEAGSFGLSDNFCRIVKEYASWLVWKQVAKTVLCWVINPLRYPYCACTSLLNWLILFIWLLKSSRSLCSTSHLLLRDMLGWHLWETLRAWRTSSREAWERISWRRSLDLHNMWLIVCLPRRCIVLHSTIWLSKHLRRLLGRILSGKWHSIWLSL